MLLGVQLLQPLVIVLHHIQPGIVTFRCLSVPESFSSSAPLTITRVTVRKGKGNLLKNYLLLLSVSSETKYYEAGDLSRSVWGKREAGLNYDDAQNNQILKKIYLQHNTARLDQRAAKYTQGDLGEATTGRNQSEHQQQGALGRSFFARLRAAPRDALK